MFSPEPILCLCPPLPPEHVKRRLNRVFGVDGRDEASAEVALRGSADAGLFAAGTCFFRVWI